MSEAFAHPFGGRTSAQELSVTVRRDALWVSLRADVPTEESTSGPPVGEVAAALVVTVDGASVPLQTVRASARPPGDHTTLVEVELRADVPLAGVHQIEVGNGNIPGVASWHNVTVWVPEDASVHGFSLCREGACRDGRWSMGESYRTTALTVSLPDDPLARAWAKAAATDARLRLASEAVDRGASGRLRGPVGWMGAAAAAFAAMIAGAARPEGRASVVLAAVVGVAGWWSGPSAAMGIGALALCHAAWAAWRGRPPVGLVTALVCGLAPGPAVLAAAVGAAAGAAALRPVDVRLLAPIAVVAAARLAVGWAS